LSAISKDPVARYSDLPIQGDDAMNGQEHSGGKAENSSKPKPSVVRFLQSLEQHFEAMLFATRWLAAPIYFGLVFGLVMLLTVFLRQLWANATKLATINLHDAIIAVLGFIDIALVTNLLLMVILVGYEHFVSKIDTADDEDRPAWITREDFAGLKLKLFASIIGITGIELLKSFMEIRLHGLPQTNVLIWLIAIHITFLFTALLSSLADWLSVRGGGTEGGTPAAAKEAGAAGAPNSGNPA
jgi:uncharacterized protein (TIGR00645 family)